MRIVLGDPLNETQSDSGSRARAGHKAAQKGNQRDLPLFVSPPTAIPFSALGAIVGHLLTDNPITILSLIGMVALSGILVNDSPVLVDFINKRIDAGMSHFEASIEGSKLRLRAILLTTLTTVAGLTPMMFETSFQAKFLIPMAVTLTFGLMFATALTLVIVPTLNMIYFDFQAIVRGGESDESDDQRRLGHELAATRADESR